VAVRGRALGDGRVKIHGLEELDRALQQLPKDIARKELRASVMAGARIVEKAAEDRAPVRDVPGWIQRSFGLTGRGFLKRSIRRATVKSGGASVTVQVGIGRAFWGALLEFGTRYMPARPWFRPAWDASREAAARKIGEDLGKRIEKNALLLGSASVRKVRSRL
jgi:HK97 gp10 family phage protein